MTYEVIKKQFSREYIELAETDLDYCSLTYGVGACQAGEHQVVTDTITFDDFAVDATITGNTTGATGTITAISGSAPTYTFTYTKTNGIDFDDGETITASGGSSGIATINGDSVLITTGDDKCFNTFETCQDRTTYQTNKTIKTYRFCTNRSPHPIAINQGGTEPDTMPFLKSVRITPTTIDVGGGLGVRSSVSCSFEDSVHSDINIDKYLTERSYNASERGSFFTKLRARNTSYQFRPFRVLTGYLVDGVFDIDNFTTRHYVIEKMDVSQGMASIVAKDPLKLASRTKAQVPSPSSGVLNSSITAGATSFTLDLTGVQTDAEYPSGTPAGKVLIGEEVIRFDRTAGSNNFTNLQRGQNNTTAAAHNADDTVQLCYEQTSKQVYEIVNDVLVNYANIDSSFIDLAAWEAEDDTFLGGLIGGIIVKPIDVSKVLVELAEAVPHYLWWDERAQLIQFTALKSPPNNANVVNMNDNIISKSFKTKDRPEMRVSTVVVNFGQFDPTKKIDEFSNYRQTYTRVDTDSFTENGSDKIKTINSRWLSETNKGQAIKLAALIGRRFAKIPRDCTFSVDAKDSDLWVGQNRSVNHRDIVDFTGQPVDTIFQILGATTEGKGNYKYECLEFKYGDEVDGDQGSGEPGVDIVYLSLDDRNINLRTIYDGLFDTPDASTKAKFIVENGVVIGAVGGTALDTGSWPAGALVTLQLDSGAFVVGQGGSAQPAANGSAGGDAIILNYDLTLVNNGVIGGGGGGGGGASDTAGGVTATAGGGGGAGDLSGLGQPSTVSPGPGITINGGNGTLQTGGVGGYAVGGTPEAEATAGAGGDLGQDGADATEGFTQYNGGAAGNAIDKNGYTLTETVTGDIRGAIIP